jgi:hypothetical protein
MMCTWDGSSSITSSTFYVLSCSEICSMVIST